MRRPLAFGVAKVLLVLFVMGAMAACGHRAPPASPTPPTPPATPATPSMSQSAHPAAPFALFHPFASASPPVSLTASDGTGMVVDALKVRIDLYGPLALTEVRVTFKNESYETLEGRFRMTLPPRSSMTRLAMKISGEWREADAAELGAARDTYDEIVHRQRDPLLVELRRPREISARVFPIVGKEHKEIVVSYVSEVGHDAPIAFPLRGLPTVGTLDVSIVDGATEPFSLHLEGERPTRDVRFDLEHATQAARADGLVAVRVRAPAQAVDPFVGPVVFLIETSGSKDLEASAKLVASIASGLGATRSPPAHASVVAYDQTTARLYDGELAMLASALPTSLAARGALGASDLERGLAAATDEATRIGASRVIVIGGGASTTSPTHPKRLQALAAAMAAAGVERLDVLGTSALADVGVYRPLTRGPFARDGAIVEDAPELQAATVLERLTHRVVDVPVVIDGATWSSPVTLVAASAGEERVVLAKLPRAERLRVRVANAAVEPVATSAPLRVLEHSIAAARLGELVAKGERDGFADPLLRRDVIATSRRHRLPSPLTALIVLESDSDRVTLRSKEAPRASSPSSRTRSRETASAQRDASHVPKAPLTMRVTETRVSGRLPPESIQWVVRQRMGVFRACYEDGLRRRPKLAGRVAVRFGIGHDGRVIDARAESSEIGDDAVVDCMVRGFATLEFPAPPGGIVTVIYPLMLAPESENSPAPLLAFPHLGFRALGYNPFRASESPPLPLPPPPPLLPWSSDYARVMALVPQKSALLAALELRSRDASPASLALLGQVFEALGDRDHAARAYGSLADLYPERAEMLRAAAVRIDHVHPGDPIALSLLRRAVAERADQPSSHHLLGLALLRAHAYEGAFEAIVLGMSRGYEARYANVGALFSTDLGLVAAAWSKAEPARAAAIGMRAASLGARMGNAPSVHAIASWETDTSDVDLFAVDQKEQPHGSILSYATDGFGPEALELPIKRDVPLTGTLRLHRRGVGGDVLGVVDIVRHDGRGDVTVEPRPFVLMTENATLPIGSIDWSGPGCCR